MAWLRRFTMAALGAAVVAGGAAPTAAADLLPPADGYYTYTQPGGPTAQWDLSSICIQANGTRAQPDYTDTTIQTLGCTLNVASTTPKNFTDEENRLNTGSRARLTGGLWTFSNTMPRGQTCPDGSKAPITDAFAFDAATLAGTRTTTWSTDCGRAPGMSKTPFTLSFNGPLQPPAVDRFPDNCNYLAGRPSICS